MKSGYMIQRKSTGDFVTVSKDTYVTIPDKKKCLRFWDEKSAMIFMHSMISKAGVVATDYVIGMEHNLEEPKKAQRNMIGIDNAKGKRWGK